ncbi:MAG: divergent PAP2 family protein [Eubacteriales bacterium]|nr:divergent PAP2 family protein [Eubacteriales bacterium]MDD3289434.1 divergent PAP2 family protein [Eubacteriales bacterium]MDD3863599.1 divergent PAP2 family protein [Eubacteriales bacterium]MDD4444406.1 divergent PAP2 family protein [Eubacteriales bacterium]
MDVLLTSVAAWLVAQLIKLFYYRRENGWFNLAVMTASGGMPSSHAALVTAATVRVALAEGVLSPLFGVSAVFALVVMYDATGVRHSVGEQAKTLNRIQEELKALIALDTDMIKEVLGHTGFQVLIGFLIGLMTGILSIWIPLP